MEKKMKKLSLVLSFTLIIGLLPGNAVFAKKRVGYGYKNGFAYSITVEDGKAKVTEINEAHPFREEDKTEGRLLIRKEQGDKVSYFFLDAEGMILGDIYDMAEPFRNGLAVVAKRNREGVLKYGVIDKMGKLLVPYEFHDISSFDQGVAIVYFSEDGTSKFGLMNKRGEVIHAETYSFMSDFDHNGIAVVGLPEGGFGLIQTEGILLTKYAYKSIEPMEGSNIYLLTVDVKGETKYNLLNNVGEELLDGYHDKIERKGNYLKISRFQKEGIADLEGRVLIPSIYGEITETKSGNFVVRDGDDISKAGLFDADGNEIFAVNYRLDDDMEGEPIRIGTTDEEERWGLIDNSGAFILPFTYKKLDKFSDGLALFTDKDGNFGFVNMEGKEVLRLGKTYQEVGAFSDGLSLVKKDGKYGFINKKGSLVIRADFEHAGNFYKKTAIVSKKDRGQKERFFLIDQNGKRRGKRSYDNIRMRADGRYSVTVTGKGGKPQEGLIDRRGKTLVPPRYDEVYDSVSGLSVVAKVMGSGEKKFGFSNPKGGLDKTILYDWIEPVGKGLFLVGKENKKGLVNGKGVLTLSVEYDIITLSEKQGSSMFLLNKLKPNGEGHYYGYADKNGRLILPCTYDYAYHFVENRGIVAKEEKNGSMKLGAVNEKGKFVVKPQYGYMELFEKGFSMVKNDGKTGYVNKSGKIIVPVNFDGVRFFEEGLFQVMKTGKKGDKFGLINHRGKVIVPVNFDMITLFE